MSNVYKILKINFHLINQFWQLENSSKSLPKALKTIENLMKFYNQIKTSFFFSKIRSQKLFFYIPQLYLVIRIFFIAFMHTKPVEKVFLYLHCTFRENQIAVKKENWKWHYGELSQAARNHRKSKLRSINLYVYFLCAPLHACIACGILNFAFRATEH